SRSGQGTLGKSHKNGRPLIVKESIGYNCLTCLFTGIFSALLIMGYAQEDDKQQKEKRQSSEQGDERQAQVMDSIDVVRDYRPMLADAVKVRRNPDMSINREAIEIELRQIAAATYF